MYKNFLSSANGEKRKRNWIYVIFPIKTTFFVILLALYNEIW